MHTVFWQSLNVMDQHMMVQYNYHSVWHVGLPAPYEYFHYQLLSL